MSPTDLTKYAPDVVELSRVLVIGDVHQSSDSIEHAFDIADEHDCQAIFQAGDFGYVYHTPSGERFLRTLSYAEVPVFFVRGNHDDTSYLKGFNDGKLYGPDPIEIQENLYWLPDGSAMTINDRTWRFFGGSFSIDRTNRKLNVSYWADELSTPAYILDAAGLLGPCEVVMAHDHPGELNEIPWLKPMIDSTLERRNMHDVMRACRPPLWIHGHYHFPLELRREDTYVVGLNCNGDKGWARVLSV